MSVIDPHGVQTALVVYGVAVLGKDEHEAWEAAMRVTQAYQPVPPSILKLLELYREELT